MAPVGLTKHVGAVEINVLKMLKLDESWASLPIEKRKALYGYLPVIKDATTGKQMDWDYSVHPVRHEVYGKAIKDYITYAEDAIGRGHAKNAYHSEAMQATKERAEGIYDGSKEAAREEFFGQKAMPVHANQASGHTMKSGTRVLYVSIDTLRKPVGVDVFLPIWQHGLDQFQSKLASAIEQQGSNQSKMFPQDFKVDIYVVSGCLIIIDSLNALCSGESTSSNLPALLSSFLRPAISLIATYHTDIPVPPLGTSNAYTPPPLTLLRFLATTIITVHSFHHLLARKQARERGVAEPDFGLDHGREGILVGEGAQGRDGFVLEMEFRRKSGRGVREWFFMSQASSSFGKLSASVKAAQRAVGLENVILLENHPSWRTEEEKAEQDEEHDVTFSIGLTDRQRRDREGVVLPYFDAQKGGGEGGRILYDMGVEDDFDDEEDEI
ncbi:hypothetical protein CAC42_3737 [Sphaceloma murrayae]|uniref:Elongator complex protein 5 n=1 Tax=Sphaceloma murrayae TaxID=2082308 RepID=A0A2K1QHP9_9PEZI|nr:hypothetical protein CAC42_3737 [Sphaceloma murrayae]